MKAPSVFHLVYDLIRGGTEGQCARVALGLSKRGGKHQVGVFHRRGYFLDVVEKTCGSAYELAIRRMISGTTMKEIVRLARFLKQNHVNLLHAWDADAAIFGQFAAHLAGIPWVTSHRDLGEIYPWHKCILLNRADRGAVRVVANSECVRARFAHGRVADKISILPNVLDVSEFDALFHVPFSRENELPVGRRMVVVNRLDSEKNTGRLIEALPHVREVISDACLVIAGAGPEWNTLNNMVSRLHLKDAVCFLGEIHEVPSLLSCCELGALVPVRNEGFSNTILEYMAASLPVLATDCGGNRELVKPEETGYLLPLHANASDVAMVWIQMLQNQDQARLMGENGRKLVSRRYDLSVGLDAFEQFYRSIFNDDHNIQ